MSIDRPPLPLRLIDSSSIKHKDGSPLPSSFTHKEEGIHYLCIVIHVVTMHILYIESKEMEPYITKHTCVGVGGVA